VDRTVVGEFVRAAVFVGDAEVLAGGDAVGAFVNAEGRAVGVAAGAFDGAAVIVVDAEGRAVGVAVGAFDGAAVYVGDAERRAVGVAVGAFVGAVVFVSDAEGRAVGVAVGAFVAAVGDAVRVGSAMHTVPLYLAVASDAQSASLELKNPIIFHVGRIDTSIPSQTYDRTMLLMLPWPGNLLLMPKDGVKL
jgi:hypothetical protein